MNKVTERAKARHQRIEDYKTEIKGLGIKAPEMFSGYKVNIYTGLGTDWKDKAWNFLRSYLNDDYAAAVREIFSESALELAKNEAEKEIKAEEKAGDQLITEKGKQIPIESMEEKIIAKIKSMPDLSETKKMELILVESQRYEDEKTEVSESETLIEPEPEDSSDQEAIPAEGYVPREGEVIYLESEDNIDHTSLTSIRRSAQEYFNDERDKILEKLPDLKQKDQLPAYFSIREIKSEQGLKEFAANVINKMLKNCIAERDLQELDKLEQRANEFFDTFTALSTEDKEDLLELITVARAEIMTRNAIDEMVEKSFLNEPTFKKFQQFSKDWGSKPGYATEAINWMVTQCNNDVKKLTKLENNVRLLLTESVPIAPSTEEKERLIGIITAAKVKQGNINKSE